MRTSIWVDEGGFKVEQVREKPLVCLVSKGQILMISEFSSNSTGLKYWYSVFRRQRKKLQYLFFPKIGIVTER